MNIGWEVMIAMLVTVAVYDWLVRWDTARTVKRNRRCIVDLQTLVAYLMLESGDEDE